MQTDGVSSLVASLSPDISYLQATNENEDSTLPLKYVTNNGERAKKKIQNETDGAYLKWTNAKKTNEGEKPTNGLWNQKWKIFK